MAKASDKVRAGLVKGVPVGRLGKVRAHLRARARVYLFVCQRNVFGCAVLGSTCVACIVYPSLNHALVFHPMFCGRVSFGVPGRGLCWAGSADH